MILISKNAKAKGQIIILETKLNLIKKKNAQSQESKNHYTTITLLITAIKKKEHILLPCTYARQHDFILIQKLN